MPGPFAGAAPKTGGPVPAALKTARLFARDSLPSPPRCRQTAAPPGVSPPWATIRRECCHPSGGQDVLRSPPAVAPHHAVLSPRTSGAAMIASGISFQITRFHSEEAPDD